MPLSLNKLRKILYEKGFITKKMYKIQHNCNFIEIISILSEICLCYTCFLIISLEKKNVIK